MKKEIIVNHEYYDVVADLYYKPIADHCTMFECMVYRKDFMGKPYAINSDLVSVYDLSEMEDLGED